VALAALSLTALSLTANSASGALAASPVFHPAVAEYSQVAASETPPTEAQCYSAARRCFTPQSVRAAYNVAPLYARGFDGTGTTIAIVDAYGSDTIAHDLHVYDQQFGVAPMCGEEGVTCQPGMPTFSQLHLQGSPATKPQPGKGTHLEDKTGWAIEVSLDVETAHAMAPGANILLVTTPTAETEGVQGFPTMMDAEQYVVDHHLADVISQSFGAVEESFGGSASLLNLRHAFVSAAQNGITVLASSGDFGTANFTKAPTSKGGKLIPYPTVQWPSSDPLVTGVGGTYLCTSATATSARVLDNVDVPVNCQGQSQDEIGWIDAGGGFSHVFSRPGYQDTLPAGSTSIPQSTRGVPDVALQSSARTGPLVYLTLPPDGSGGLLCGNDPCSTGWYVIGGTSVACPQWAALVAIADQMNGGGLGLINPALYQVAANPAQYAADYFDVTTGNNQTDPSVPGYSATPGWDPVTGLGTPNAAQLLPALVAASH
jgi:subtilase family serine protease